MPTVSSDLLRNALASAADSSGRQTNPKHWPGMGRFPQHTFLRHLEGIAARTPSDLEFGMEDRSQRWESLAATARAAGTDWSVGYGSSLAQTCKSSTKMKSGKDAGKLAEF